MDCEKVRDRFSSLLEKELTTIEEKIIKEHLASCSECKRELAGFEKTMQWLHSTNEVDVPEGFLPELYKKMEERKKAFPVKKMGEEWFRFPLLLKLPAQAVAMVAIVFLVLYLTKTTPMENYRVKETLPEPSPLSTEKKPEERLLIPFESSRPKKSEPADVRSQEKEREQKPQEEQVEGEEKRTETPSEKTEVMAHRIESKDRVTATLPSPEHETIRKEGIAKQKSIPASKPLEEMVLRISDRVKAISQIHEIIKQFGGEMIRTEDQLLIVSLPTSSISEFKKELGGLSGVSQADALTPPQQDRVRLRAPSKPVREEVDERRRELAGKGTDEPRTVVRILLLE